MVFLVIRRPNASAALIHLPLDRPSAIMCPTVTCTFEVTETLEQEQDGLPAGTVVTFGGEVTGFLTGR